MEITPKFKFIEGSFDTDKVTMCCIPDDNHGVVHLCVKEKDSNWNIPIGEIKLYDSDLYIDFKATIGEAKRFGDEISRRWNTFRKEEGGDDQ